MDYILARQYMMKSQIRPNRVEDPAVLEAMETLPRELFLPKSLRDIAYVDTSIDLGGGRFLLEPLVMARLLQAAEIRSTDVVLEIGYSCGYGTALLGRMASTVVSIEADETLAAETSARLLEFGIDNAAVVNGNLAEGYAAQAPYDVIFINGSVAEIPGMLLEQLAVNGRLVGVVRGESGTGRGVVVQKTEHGWGRRELFDAGVPFVPGFTHRNHFTF